MTRKRQLQHKPRMSPKRKFVLITLALFGFASVILVGKWIAHHSTEKTALLSSANTVESSTTPLLPPWLAHANPVVRNAYTFAFTHPKDLSYIPCYCGCDRLGHTSVRDCYIQNTDPSGRITASHHAEYCNICLGIALDTQAALAQHIPLAEIRARIDRFYARFGQPTPTPPPSVAPTPSRSPSSKPRNPTDAPGSPHENPSP